MGIKKTLFCWLLYMVGVLETQAQLTYKDLTTYTLSLQHTCTHAPPTT